MSHKILLIDDSKPIHRLVQAWMKNDPVELLFAHDGKSGIAAAVAAKPDLILLDVEMPGQNGFDVCRTLQADPITATIPIVFLTSNSSIEHKVTGLNLGAVDYVTKPFNPAELRAPFGLRSVERPGGRRKRIADNGNARLKRSQCGRSS